MSGSDNATVAGSGGSGERSDDPRHGADGTRRGRDADAPSEIPAAGWKDIAVRVKDEIADDHTVLAAAGVAFFAFLAVVPALAALVSIAGLVTSPSNAADRVESMFGGLPSEAQDLLSSQLESVAGQSGGSLSIGVAVAIALSLWAASGGMGHLVEGINVAYDEHDDRNFLHRKALSLALTLGAIGFLVFAVVGIAALPALLDAAGISGWAETVLQLVFWPVLMLGFAAGLAVVYRVGPDRDAPKWRWVSWGSVVAVVLWIAASIGFRVYVATFGSYSESYGSLAAVVVLLLFLFISSFVVLLGAQINSEMEHQTARDTTQGPDEPLGQRGAVMADTVGRSSD
jgi:membrane protein